MTSRTHGWAAEPPHSTVRGHPASCRRAWGRSLRRRRPRCGGGKRPPGAIEDRSGATGAGRGLLVQGAVARGASEDRNLAE